jgi:Undecaprenyl-phosphate glucose phosphotransferase
VARIAVCSRGPAKKADEAARVNTVEETKHTCAIGGSTFSKSIVSGVLLISDAFAIVITGALVYAAYLDLSDHPFVIYGCVLALYSTLVIGVFYLAGLYEIDPLHCPLREAKRIVPICIMIFLSLVALGFAMKISALFSRVWVFSWFLLSTGIVIACRMTYYAMLRKWGVDGRLTRTLAIVGTGQQAKTLLDRLETLDCPWMRIIGFFDDRLNRAPSTIGNYRVLGTVKDLVRYARGNRCDDIILTLPWSAEERISSIVHELKVLPTCVRLSPNLIGLHYDESSYSRFAGVPVINIVSKPIDGWKSIAKTIEDRLAAAMLILIFSPILLIIALLIKLDSPGPVFFRQTRFGFNNQGIEVMKFRTMYVDKEDLHGAQLTVRNDPRVTRIGGFLRRTSLDELPQLLNVLWGQMSIVGPRPHAIKANVGGGKLYEEAVAEYALRHKVKPGITGWAQINGWRGETDTDEKIRKRVEHDLFYIENWSLLLDLKIIVRTVRVLFAQENAF